MPTTSLNILITWFQTGNKPTGEQYEQLIRSLAHKDDLQAVIDLLDSKANAADVSALLPIVRVGVNSYTFPAMKRVADVIIIAPTATNIGAGLTPGGYELTDPVACIADGNNLGISHFFKAGTTIYFDGVLDDTQIIIY